MHTLEISPKENNQEDHSDHNAFDDHKELTFAEVREKERQSRRRFLKGLGAGVVTAALGGVGGPTLRDYALEVTSKEVLLKSIEEKKRIIKEIYYIDVQFEEFKDFSEFHKKSSDLRLAQQERGITMLLEELSKLPPLLIKGSPLKTIALRSDLHDTKVSNANLEKRLTYSIGGVVYYHNSTRDQRKMVLNIGGDLADGYHLFGWTEGNVRTVFSHELFHALDTLDREEWSKLQAGVYGYAKPGKEDIFAEMAYAPLNGFARSYGATNAQEDKATVYEALASQDQYEKVLKRSLQDKVLTKKINTIQTFIRSISCGLMDRSYWVDALGKIGSEYYKQKARKLLAETPETYCHKNPEVSEGEFTMWQKKLKEEYGEV